MGPKNRIETRCRDDFGGVDPASSVGLGGSSRASKLKGSSTSHPVAMESTTRPLQYPWPGIEGSSTIN